MKRLHAMLGFVIIALVLGIATASADVGESPGLGVVLTSQSPYPVEPGQNLNIQVEIQNNGYADATDRIVEIIPQAPFELLPGEQATKLFSNIPAQGSIKTSYKLIVNSSAYSNDYELNFRIYPSGLPSSYIQDSITIHVRGVPDLLVTSVTTEPGFMEPGGMATITFDIKNIGTGTARQVKAEIDSDSSYLIPVLSGGLVLVGDIEPNGIGQAQLQMSVDSSADYKTYITMLTLSYKDENNTQMEESLDIGIPVTGSINLDIISIEPDYDRNSLKIQVANKGTTDAKSVEARLMINDNLVGIDYISQLKASKYTTFDFPLTLQGTGRLEIHYIGPTLQTEQIQEEVILNYPDPTIANTISTIVGLFLFFLIVRMLWKHFKGDKGHH